VRKVKRVDQFQLFLLLSLFILLSGCAPISKELRSKADLALFFSDVFQNPEAYRGKIVIWGGEIIETVNQKDGTTLIGVLQRPLDWMEVPKERKSSGGRFLILVEKYLDPYIFRRGRKITVAGEILGEKRRLIGEMEYRYPLILSKQIYLWRESYYAYLPPYYPHYPWRHYGPWWYYDPWWGYPYWW
jgi:outer membrane lipoprotein